MSDRLKREREYTFENYENAKNHLIEVEKMMDDKVSINRIKEKYKELKEWFKTEYKKVSKYKYYDGYISRYYAPMITDIYIQSFYMAKTNSSIDKIHMAVIDGLNYYEYWSGHLEKK